VLQNSLIVHVIVFMIQLRGKVLKGFLFNAVSCLQESVRMKCDV